MDKVQQAAKRMLDKLEKEKQKAKQKKALDKLAHKLTESQRDEVRRKTELRISERRKMELGWHEAIIVPLIDICRPEQDAMIDAKDDDATYAAIVTLQKAFDTFGKNLSKSGKTIYVVDETEDYPRIVYWYNPRTHLWYHDVYQQVADLRDIVNPKRPGYSTLGTAWEES
jgi:bisphosphoglycerate-independent phosphoglycerate mutase (AlkP superfamily)